MEAAPRAGSKKKVEMFLNRMSKNPILLVLLTLLVSSSGKDVLPSLRFLFALLASQIHDSSEAQQAGLFVLVNFIVLAILVRSKSPPSSSSSSDSYPSVNVVSNSTRHVSRHRSRRQWASSSSYPDFTDDIHETTARRYTAQDLESNAKKKVMARISSMGKKSASYPLLSPDMDVHDVSNPGIATNSPQIENKEEQVAVYKDDLSERIEAFIARNREQWERQRQESLERRRRF